MIQEVIAKTVVGKTVKETEIICKKNNLACRVMNEDGEAYMGTCDFRQNRLNLTVNKGVVTKVSIG